MSTLLVINLLAFFLSIFVVGCVLGAVFSKPFRKKLAAAIGIGAWARRDAMLVRISCNPVLSPGSHPWNAQSVLNPAAVALGGRTHLVYRAIGMDGVSRLGYASSGNGLIFDDQLPYAIYASTNPRNLPRHGERRYNPILYPSGGSWGGCEDPRMVAINGRVYLTFNSFDGWDFIRVAMISLSQEDFLAKRWRWSAPKLLSPAGEVHKNWVIFPEKIGGRFAILHGVYGEDTDHVRVAYTDDLESFDPETLRGKSVDPNAMPWQSIAWHTKMKSAGPPPLKTEAGWLVFYHAYGEAHGRYELGALLLDLADPTRILHRAPEPVLSPDEHDENHGRLVVYACGAVIRDDMLYVYYGGGDRVVCVAFTPLMPFLKALMRGEPATLTAEPTQTA
ncbi:hypothetical protein HY091_02915 [Candidatus Kaiserbacteria bacterium]|nr:hypothetical protein [Candidatus Kaiserbacteria bacterium]